MVGDGLRRGTTTKEKLKVQHAPHRSPECKMKQKLIFFFFFFRFVPFVISTKTPSILPLPPRILNRTRNTARMLLCLSSLEPPSHTLHHHPPTPCLDAHKDPQNPQKPSKTLPTTGLPLLSGLLDTLRVHGTDFAQVFLGLEATEDAELGRHAALGFEDTVLDVGAAYAEVLGKEVEDEGVFLYGSDGGFGLVFEDVDA